MYAYHELSRDKYLFARACGRKRCEICGTWKRFALVRRITAAKPTKFLTLSVRHEGEPLEQLKRCCKQLSQLVARIRKQFGPVEYVRVLEWCIDGYPHLHLLARMEYVPQEWISRNWADLTGAVVVDIRKAHGSSTRYVAKYVAKATGEIDQWTRQTISASRGFWKRNDTPSQYLGWHTANGDVWSEAEILDQDWALQRIRRGVYWLNEREPGDELPEELHRPNLAGHSLPLAPLEEGPQAAPVF